MAFKFRHKLLLAFMATTLLALGIFVLVSLERLQEAAELRTRQGLESARAAFFESQRQLGEALSDSVKTLVTSTPDLQAVLAGRVGTSQSPFEGEREKGDAEDSNTLESTIPFTPLYEKSEQFLVVDTARKVLLAKRPDLLPPASDLALDDALSGRQGYAWWPEAKGGTLQVFASPVITPSGVVGAILVGIPVDRAFLAPLEKISRTAIDIAPSGGDRKAKGIFEVIRAGARQVGGYVPILSPSGAEVGSFLITRSTEEEERDAAHQAHLLEVFAALILLVSAGVALYLSRLVSRPLEALGRAVTEVKGGNFAYRLRSPAGDEFGKLSGLIDDMAAGLEERERIRATFNRYVDDEVVAEVLKSEGADALAGNEREITVLFADLANFTAFSEGKSPRDLLRDLNTYFAAMAKAVDEEKGILDKFIGDAIMAYWGAPVANPRHSELACRAALEMAKRFRSEISPRFPKLGLRIGLATGNALVGNVGSERRQNYTVMGDTVNLASRLEGVNRTFGTVSCVSGRTREAAGNALSFRYLGRVRVAGRSEPEKIYEILPENFSAEAVQAYEAAVSHFERADLSAAAALVRPHAGSGDGPSLAMLKRCEDQRKHDRRDGPWDGVWNLGK